MLEKLVSPKVVNHGLKVESTKDERWDLSF
jgi:hypothetical protein